MENKKKIIISILAIAILYISSNFIIGVLLAKPDCNYPDEFTLYDRFAPSIIINSKITELNSNNSNLLLDLINDKSRLNVIEKQITENLKYKVWGSKTNTDLISSHRLLLGKPDMSIIIDSPYFRQNSKGDVTYSHALIDENMLEYGFVSIEKHIIIVDFYSSLGIAFVNGGIFIYDPQVISDQIVRDILIYIDDKNKIRFEDEQYLDVITNRPYKNPVREHNIFNYFYVLGERLGLDIKGQACVTKGENAVNEFINEYKSKYPKPEVTINDYISGKVSIVSMPKFSSIEEFEASLK